MKQIVAILEEDSSHTMHFTMPTVIDTGLEMRRKISYSLKKLYSLDQERLKTSVGPGNYWHITLSKSLFDSVERYVRSAINIFSCIWTENVVLGIDPNRTLFCIASANHFVKQKNDTNVLRFSQYYFNKHQIRLLYPETSPVLFSSVNVKKVSNCIGFHFVTPSTEYVTFSVRHLHLCIYLMPVCDVNWIVDVKRENTFNRYKCIN